MVAVLAEGADEAVTGATVKTPNALIDNRDRLETSNGLKIRERTLRSPRARTASRSASMIMIRGRTFTPPRVGETNSCAAARPANAMLRPTAIADAVYDFQIIALLHVIDKALNQQSGASNESTVASSTGNGTN
jgi:hypothetical protein